MEQSYLSRFTTQLTNFINDLHELVPEQRGFIEKVNVIVDMLKKTNPRLLKDNFLSFVTPYKEKIMADDEKFFLSFNQYTEEKSAIAQILSLKEIWQNDFSQQNKDNIKNYMKVLIYLAERA
jgi:hypothetical protein